MKIKIWMDMNAAANASRYFKRAKEVEEAAVKKRPKPRRGPKAWYERFRWSFTSHGELVLIGKNQEQNLRLLRKYAGPHDWLFHADIPGSAVVLLMGDRDKREAAQLAACFSSAWKRNYASMDVYAFRKGQINFSGPLMKGTFQVIGDREWFRNEPLGLKLSMDEEQRLNILSLHHTQSGFAKVFPGNTPKHKVAHILEEWGVVQEDVLSLLPDRLRLIIE